MTCISRPERLGEMELARLAELLDVDRLVTGTVREAGGVVRVDLKLIDRHLPDAPATAIRAEAPASELFKLSDQLAADLRTALAAAPAPLAESSLSADGEAMAAYAKGLDLQLKGDTVAAGTAFEEAVAEDPRFTSAWVKLAGAYRTLGYDDKALEAARQAVSHLSERSGRIRYEARALEAALAGNFEQSQQQLTELVTRYPNDLEARVTLAEAYGDEGQLDRAAKELKTIVAASPNHPRAWYLLGKYAILAGDARAAADEYLVRALVIQNRLGNLQGRADAENALGIAHFELGNLDEARQRYGNAIDLRTKIGDERGVAAATANVARIQLQQGKYDEARAGLQQSLLIVERIGNYETVANLHNEIGALEERQGRYREALERYRQSLAILRDLGDQRALAESYNNIGFTHYQLGDFDNAAVYAQTSMQLYDKTENREGRMYTGQTVGLLALARGDWRGCGEIAARGLAARARVRGSADPGARARPARPRRPMAGQFRRGARLDAPGARSPDGRRRPARPRGARLVRGGPRVRGRHAGCGPQIACRGAGDPRRVGQPRAARGVVAPDGHRAPARKGFRQGARGLRGRAPRRRGKSGSAIARLSTELGAMEASLAAGDNGPRLNSLAKLHAEAQGLGHVPLLLQSGELLARAHVQAGRLAEAERQLRASLRAADGHAPWGGRYRLHWQLADVLEKLGRGAEAGQQRRAAATEVERLRKGLDATQRESFEQLEEVRQLAGSVEQAPAA